MSKAIYWFRNDLRLHDNPLFLKACQELDYLLPLFVVDSDRNLAPWNLPAQSQNKAKFVGQCLVDLRNQLIKYGSTLVILQGEPTNILLKILHANNINTIYCEDIKTPYEKRELDQLKQQGITIITGWQSTMLDIYQLPFEPQKMPDVFTSFRKAVEQCPHRYAVPIKAPTTIPPLPFVSKLCDEFHLALPENNRFGFQGGESAALDHVEQYFKRRLIDTYKKTRNELSRFDASSKFSPWLAMGCISAGFLGEQIDQYESQFGSNDGTYWLWFELLWRDFFRLLAIKYGDQIFYPKGLGNKRAHVFNLKEFERWTSGATGNQLIDAGMRELLVSGYLSNRMRQIVASYWIYNLHGNWLAGAAWFESQLIDYDVYSNQGNWLYIAGHGTDPRGGRPFNTLKQATEYDPDGSYQQLWNL